MAQVQCECGENIEDALDECPHCGLPLNSTNEIFFGLLTVVVLGAFANILILAVLCLLLYHGDNSLSTCLSSPLAWTASLALWGWLLKSYNSDKKRGFSYKFGKLMMCPLLLVLSLNFYFGVKNWNARKANDALVVDVQQEATTADLIAVAPPLQIGDQANKEEEIAEVEEAGIAETKDNSELEREPVSSEESPFESLANTNAQPEIEVFDNNSESDQPSSEVKENDFALEIQNQVPVAIMAIEADEKYVEQVADNLYSNSSVTMLRKSDQLTLYQVNKNNLHPLMQLTPYMLRIEGKGHKLIYAFREGDSCRELMSDWINQHLDKATVVL